MKNEIFPGTFSTDEIIGLARIFPQLSTSTRLFQIDERAAIIDGFVKIPIWDYAALTGERDALRVTTVPITLYEVARSVIYAGYYADVLFYYRRVA